MNYSCGYVLHSSISACQTWSSFADEKQRKKTLPFFSSSSFLLSSMMKKHLNPKMPWFHLSQPYLQKLSHTMENSKKHLQSWVPAKSGSKSRERPSSFKNTDGLLPGRAKSLFLHFPSLLPPTKETKTPMSDYPQTDCIADFYNWTVCVGIIIDTSYIKHKALLSLSYMHLKSSF